MTWFFFKDICITSLIIYMTKPQIYFSIFSFGYSLAPTSSSKLICCSIPRCWIKQRQHTRVLNYREWEPAWPRPSYYPDLRPWTKYLASWNLRCLIMIPTSLSCCKNKKNNKKKTLSVTCWLAQCRHTISTQSVPSASSLDLLLPGLPITWGCHTHCHCHYLIPSPAPGSHCCRDQSPPCALSFQRLASCL